MSSGYARVTLETLAVQRASQRIWPGITDGFDARCLCTWAFHRGVYQVKYTSPLCLHENHARHGRP